MDRILQSKNILLKRDDVGAPKPCVVPLPAKSHVYGKPEFSTQPGVGVLTTTW